MSLLFNKPFLSWLISLLISLVVIFLRPTWSAALYEKFAGGLVTDLIAFLGFIVTAIAILLSVSDNGVLGEMKRRNPKLWKQLMSVFFSTAKFTGIFALLLLVSSLISVPGSVVWQRAFYGFFGFFFVASAFQAMKLVMALEIAATMSTMDPSPSKR